MYQFLRGIVTEKITSGEGIEKLILDVNGVGYEIYITEASIGTVGKKGELATVYTTLIHKEDSMVLYGFPTLLERELFNLLQSVSGIGPKTALNVLSNLTVSEVSYSILNEDSEVLCKAHGIGRRTAERIILELKEKIKNWQYLPIVHIEKKETGDGKQETGNSISEARSVLQALGYSSHEINKAITQAKGNGDIEDSESLVHVSLKWLSTTKK